jgi:serine/threonine protein kinase
VSPSSFQKIKLLGRGDVGKVFLVREKKTGKLFAMKGGPNPHRLAVPIETVYSTVQERDDSTKKD